MDRLLTKEQVELLRAGLLASEWCGYVKRPMVNALCDLALSALSQEAVRDEALEKEFDTLHKQIAEATATVDEIETILDGRAFAPKAVLEALEEGYAALADITNQWEGRHTLAGQALLCKMRNAIAEATGRTAEDVQDNPIALKREPNAAGQADLGPETDGTPGRSASGSPGGGAVHPDAEARAWGSEPGGASDRGARAGNVVARPAPAAPDVARLIRNLLCADTATIVFAAKEAAALLAKLGQGWIPPEGIVEIDEYGKVQPYGTNLQRRNNEHE